MQRFAFLFYDSTAPRPIHHTRILPQGFHARQQCRYIACSAENRAQPSERKVLHVVSYINILIWKFSSDLSKYIPISEYFIDSLNSLCYNGNTSCIVDLGLRNHIVPRRNYDLGFSLENVVYFELLRRGYKVMIGKLGSTEVDFVAEKQGEYVYYQVTADMTAQETFEREMRPLTMIGDNYEKIILTADHLTVGNYKGIRVKNLTDWLLGKDA